MQLILWHMLENIIFCGIDTLRHNIEITGEGMNSHEQWQSVKPFRRIFSVSGRYFKCFSHFVFSFDPTRRILWLSPKESPLREFLQVGVPHANFQVSRLMNLIFLPWISDYILPHPTGTNKEKKEKNNARNSCVTCSIDGSQSHGRAGSRSSALLQTNWIQCNLIHE